MFDSRVTVRPCLPLWPVLTLLLVTGCGGVREDTEEERGRAGPGASASPAVRSASPERMERALWVGETAVATQETARAELLGVCAKSGVDGLFVNMSPFPDHQNDPVYLGQLRGLVSGVRAAGMRLHALRPMPVSPKLVYPRAHYVAVTYLRDFLKYNAAAGSTGRFGGVLLDVQPHILPGWGEDESGLQEHFIEFVAEMRRTVIEFGEGVELGWVVPASYLDLPRFFRLCDLLDYMVLTETGDEPDARVAAVRRALAACGDTEPRVFLAVDPRVVGENAGRELARQLGHARFAGVVLEDYARLRELQGTPEG